LGFKGLKLLVVVVVCSASHVCTRLASSRRHRFLTTLDPPISTDCSF